MNSNRTNFIKNLYQKIKTTFYRLLGFILGEGGFPIDRISLTSLFQLGLTLNKKPVLLSLVNFLYNKF